MQLLIVKLTLDVDDKTVMIDDHDNNSQNCCILAMCKASIAVICARNSMAAVPQLNDRLRHKHTALYRTFYIPECACLSSELTFQGCDNLQVSSREMVAWR